MNTWDINFTCNMSPLGQHKRLTMLVNLPRLTLLLRWHSVNLIIFLHRCWKLKSLQLKQLLSKRNLARFCYFFKLKFYFPLICHINVTKCILVQWYATTYYYSSKCLIAENLLLLKYCYMFLIIKQLHFCTMF